LVFNATTQLAKDPETAAALVQALAKSKFEFKTANGDVKTCGVDILNQTITKATRLRVKNTTQKAGKQTPTGQISAQERDQDVLVVNLTNEEESQVLDYAPEQTDAVKAKNKKKEVKITPKPTGGGKSAENTRKRKPRTGNTELKFYYDSNSEQTKMASSDWSSHQLLVHGLSSHISGQRPPTAGPQEVQLNNLMAELSTNNLGADGINITQKNIIGAILLDPTTGDNSQITRITLDTRERHKGNKGQHPKSGRECRQLGERLPLGVLPRHHTR
jgi:hypothetical protein